MSAPPGDSPAAGTSSSMGTAAVGASSPSVPPPGSPARNTRSQSASAASVSAPAAASAAATAATPTPSTSASAASGKSGPSASAPSTSASSASGKGGPTKGTPHPNEVIFRTALDAAHQLVKVAGFKLVDPTATAADLQQQVQASATTRRALPTLDTSGIPNPRKQRLLNDAAAQVVALQTLEDILRMQAQNLQAQASAGGAALAASLPVAVTTTVAGLVAASSAALTTASSAPYAAATAAALAASASTPELTGAQSRLLNIAHAGMGTTPNTATSAPGAALAPATQAVGGSSSAAPTTPVGTVSRLTPTTLVGPAFLSAPHTATVAALPPSLPSLGGGSYLGGSTPSLPQAVPGIPPPTPAAAVGPFGANSSSAPAAAGMLENPPWIPVPGELNEGNQFTTTCSQGPAYYMSFPPPWNMLPPAEDSHLNTMLKIAPQSLPKFSGDRRSYVAWRNTFIPCVHLTNIDVRYKAMLLRSSLEPNSARMREFMESIAGTGPGYRYAVTELENRYGGQEAVLMAKQDALLALPVVKEGDYRTIETMQARLANFLVEWTTIAGAPITESESLAFYTMLMSKIDSIYTLKYLGWLQQFGFRKGVQSLYQWLANELRHHRTAEAFARQRLKGNFPPASKPGGAGGAQASRFPPQYHHLLNQAGEDEGGEALALEGEHLGEAEEYSLLARGKGGAGGVSRRPPCPLCAQDHGLGRCAKFKEMNPSERKGLLARERRCFLCFQRGHNVGRCVCTYSCAHCQQRHHTMLHGASEEKSTTLYTQQEEEEDFEAATETLQFGLKAAVREEGRISLRTLPILLINPGNGKRMKVNALLDDGCTTAALVSEEAAAELGLAGPATWRTTEGVGGKVTRYRTILTVVEVCSLASPFRRKLPTQVMRRPAGTYRAVDWRPHVPQFSHLSNIPILPPEGEGRIDILLGSKCAELLSSREEVVGGQEAPVARRTALGWTITGPTGETPQREREAVPLESALFLSSGTSDGGAVTLVPLPKQKGFRLQPSDKQLAQLVQRMLEVEDPGEAEVLSPKEEYIIKTLRSSLQMVEGKYQVACTWAPGAERPPLNLHLARGRLRNLERGKVFKDPKMRAAYGAVFVDWEDKGIVRRVELSSVQVRHVLPHFPIIKESESTPVRPVMGCDVALNKFLLPGPNLLNEVVGVLLRFRSGKVTVAGDIKQMFLNIRLAPEDRPYHCFLWNQNPEDSDPIVYQFQRHVFGNAGSPCVAVFVLKEHARKSQASAPAAVDTLLNSTLIDDVLDSVETEEEAVQLLADVRKIIAQAGMKLAKIHTNSPGVAASVPRDILAAGALDLSAAGLAPALHGLKTLGLAYRAQEDEFYFTMEAPPVQAWTKRGVLKLFPRLFDPLGLLLPFSIRARIHFSSLTKLKVGWDDKLPRSTAWEEWLAELKLLSCYQIPRNVGATCPGQAELHVFADASMEAYAAAAYLVVTQAGKSVSNLVFAKAHVAPAKPLTVPRLELLAAHLAIKVRKISLTHLKGNIAKVFHWSDSLTVLFWLNDDSQRFQAFVSNKLQKIRAASSPHEWKWVPSEQNPADWATRGKTPPQLQGSALWKSGPPFLLCPPGSWPKTPALIRTSDVLHEMKKTEQVFVHHAAAPVLPLPLTRFSTWKRALSLLTALLRWRDSARLNLRLPALQLPARRAELLLIRAAQTEMREALSSAASARAWRKNFGLTQLEPFLDAEGILRGRGRLSQARLLPRDAREPIILPYSSPLTVLLIRFFHAEVLHHAGGVSYTLNRLLARFWLPRARRKVFETISTCVPCRRRLVRPLSQPVGDLPALRFPQEKGKERPFAVTAVDCAGPFKVKRGRSYEQHYLLLFTCCHIRAVRLEALSDLTTDAFLLALTRAGSHGVDPHTILSDNGGNFDGANRLLRALWAALPQEELQRRRPLIRWRFNPPYASHYGGVFERLIGAAKFALYHALPSHSALSLEQLQTAFAVVEGILNSRPLAYVSAHEADIQPLTPNHFLGGGGSRCWLSFAETTAGSTLAKRWTAILRFTTTLWDRFYKEITPFMLLSTAKRTANSRADLAVGDVVMFLLPSGEKRWPLGRVSKVFPGPDGRVRTVEITTASSSFRRDVRQVSLLLPADRTTPPLI